MASIQVAKVVKPKTLTMAQKKRLASSKIFVDYGTPQNNYFTANFTSNAKGFAIPDDGAIEVDNGKLILTSTQRLANVVSFTFDKTWPQAAWPEDFTLGFQIKFTDWGTNLTNQIPQFQIQMSAVDNGKTITRTLTMYGSVDKAAHAFSLGYGYSFSDDGQQQQVSRLATNKGAGPYMVNVARKNHAVGFSLGQDDMVMFDLPGSMQNITFTLIGFASDSLPPGVQFMQVELDKFLITGLAVFQNTIPAPDSVIYEQDFSGSGVPSGWTGTLDGGKLKVVKPSNNLYDQTFWTFTPNSPLTSNWYLSFDITPDGSQWPVQSPGNSIGNFPTIGFEAAAVAILTDPRSYSQSSGQSDGSDWFSWAGFGKDSAFAPIREAAVGSAPIRHYIAQENGTFSITVGDGVASSVASPIFSAGVMALKLFTPVSEEQIAFWIDNLLLTNVPQQ